MTYGLSRRVLFASALVVGGLVAGCGGGGRSGPAAVPALANSHGVAGQVSIKIPPKTTTGASARKPAYVSPDTESIGVVVTPDGQPAFPVVMIDVPGSDCTGDSETGYECTVTVLAQPGDNALTITTYSLPNGGGSVLSSGTFEQSFTAGQSPAPVNVTLSGVVSTVVLSIQHDDINGVLETDQNVPVGQSATLDVTAEDAAGNAIIGQYAAPINVSSSSSGLTLGVTTFKDSTTTSTQISWKGAPYYYGAPIDEVDFQAVVGTTQVGSIQLNPESTVLTFPAGDGTPADDQISLGLFAVANKLYYTTFGYGLPSDGGDGSDGEALSSQGGNLGVVDVAAGTQTVSSQLNYLPAGIYVDPAYQGIWVANIFDQTYGTGTLECYPGVTGGPAADVPVPVPHPSAGPESDPLSMTSDSQNNLWFADGSNSDIGFAPLTGQCAMNGTDFTLFASPTNSDFTTLATDGNNVFVNDLENPDVWWANAGSSGITSELLPASSNVAAAVSNDQAGNIDVADVGETGNSTIDTIPSGTTAFGSQSVSVPGLQAYDLTSVGTGDGKIFAAANLGLGNISYVPVGSPALATNLGAPNAAEDYGCTVVAFDAGNMPWAICSDGTYAHLERFILTDAAWNLFLDTSAVGLGESYESIGGIGGGSPSTTFTIACSGVVDCTTVSGRSFYISAESAGAATVQVTGSDGRVVTQNFTVTLSQGPASIGRRLAQSALGRRLFGKRLANSHLRR